MAHRIGVIPFDVSQDKITVLVVTSRRRGRWVLPKGKLKKGESHKKGCKREAFEEAGITGNILTDYPMTVPIKRRIDAIAQHVPVTFYPMRVTDQVDEWPEQEVRARQWVALDEATSVIDKADQARVIAWFKDMAPWMLAAAK